MKFNELIKTNTAGPRQTSTVEKALKKALSAAQGTVVLSNAGPTVQWMFGCNTPEEQANIDRVETAIRELFTAHENTLTPKNYKIIAEALGNLSKFASDGRPVRDERKTEEQEGQERAQRIEAARRSNEKYQEQQAQEKAEKEEVEANPEYQHLEKAATSKKSGHALAAANIKRELKRLFPYTKFSTKSDSFSGGDSVHINWTDGPTEKQVDAIADKYQYSDFDGMQDMSITRKEGRAFRAAFGDAKYISCSRTVNQELGEKVKEAVTEKAPTNIEGWELTRYISEQSNRAVYNTDLTGKGKFKGVTFDYEKQRYVLDFENVETPAPEPTRPPAPEGSFTVEKHVHTKRGFDMFLVIPTDRLPKDLFSSLLESAKGLGGWYSRAWQGTPGGFAFKEESAAQSFAVQSFGFTEEASEITPEELESLADFKTGKGVSILSNPQTGRTPTNPPFQQPKSADYKPTPSLPEKFREQADKLQTSIDSAFAPLSQNPTPKRLHQQQCKRLKGEHMERVQAAFRALAYAIEGDCLPVELRGVKTKATIERLTAQRSKNLDYYTTIGTGEYIDQTPEGKALQELIEGSQTPDPEREKKQELEKLQHGVALTKIPGFFPTPKALAARMAEMAEIGAGDIVLEPSAGTGRLAEAAREAGASVIHCFEVDRRLSRILELKGFSVEREDFTEADALPCYDAVIMNPPFEKRQDAAHVQFAYTLLKEGGRLVAIMGEGVFFGTDSKAAAFRGWLDSVGGTSEKLPEGTFKESGTGVNSRLVFIRK